VKAIRLFLSIFLVTIISNAGNLSFTLADWHYVGEAGFSDSAVNSTSLILDVADSPYVAFSDFAKANKTTVMKYIDSEWVNVSLTGFSAAEATFVDMAIDHHSNLYVAYKDWNSPSNGVTVMYYGGWTSWEVLGTEGFSAGFVEDVKIAVGSDKIPYVAYMDGAHSNKETVMKYTGSIWENVGEAGFSPEMALSTCLALDSNNAPVVVFADAINNCRATAMKFNGSNWKYIGAHGFSPEEARYISFVISSHDTPFVAFYDTSQGGKITVMKYNGSDWVTVGTPGFSDSFAYSISIAVNEADVPYVVYMDKAATNYRGTAKMFDGSNWVNLGLPGFTEDSLDYTSLKLDSNNIPIVAYKDYGNNNKASVMKYSDNVTPTPTPVPTATNLGVRIILSYNPVHPMEDFSVKGFLDTSEPLSQINVFCILDVYQTLFFWPSWTIYDPPANPDIDFQTMDIPAGSYPITFVPKFMWPDTGQDTVSGLYFYGAMLNPTLEYILGDMAIVEWGYAP